MPQLPATGTANPPSGPPGAGGSSWEALYGRLILRDGIATIPLALYLYGDQLALSAQQVWFASCILAHKWDADLPYPRLTTVAEQTGISIRTLQYIRRSLETMGYLQVHEGWDSSGRRIANSYDFSDLFAALEAAIAGDPEGDNGLQEPNTLPDPPPAEGRDRSFIARYGRVISQKGIAAVPQALFTHQAALALSPQQTWFVAYILGRRWTTQLPHPSLRRMAQRTGYSERQIHNLKEELVSAGYLRLVQRRDASGGQDTNGYDFSGLLTAITLRLQAAAPADETTRRKEVAALGQVSVKQTLQPRRGRRRVEDPPVLGDAAAAALPVPAQSPPTMQAYSVPLVQVDSVPLVQKSSSGLVQVDSVPPVQDYSVGQAQLLSASLVQLRSAGRVQGATVGTVQGYSGEPVQAAATGAVQQGAVGAVQAPASPAREFRGRGARPFSREGATDCNGTGASPFRQREAVPKETKTRDDSNRSALCAGATDGSTAERYSPYIAGVILDHSRELGDGLHAPANVTQAHRLWHACGLDENTFVAALHEARRRVRTYQGKQGSGTIHNRMGYFFRVVTDLTAPAESV